MLPADAIITCNSFAFSQGLNARRSGHRRY
jgi:hypothetical protein